MNIIKISKSFGGKCLGLLLGGMSLLSCGPAFQNALYEADEAFRQALPRQEQLALEFERSAADAESGERTSGEVEAAKLCKGGTSGALPVAGQAHRRAGSAASALKQGQVDGEPQLSCTPSSYQNLTAQVVASVNETLGDLLSLLDRMRSAPPSARTQLSRQWGPYAVGEGEPVYLLLEMVYREPLYEYELWVGSQPEYLPDLAMKGQYLYLTSPEEGEGSFWFSADVRRQYFPEATVSGSFYVDYVLTPELRQVMVEGRGLTDDSHSLPSDQVVAYETSPTEGGLFYFDRPYNLDDNDGQVERISIWTRWEGSGQGRADGAYYFESPQVPLQQGTECWDDQYNTTYYQYACGEAGEPSLCMADAIGWNEEG